VVSTVNQACKSSSVKKIAGPNAGKCVCWILKRDIECEAERGGDAPLELGCIAASAFGSPLIPVQAKVISSRPTAITDGIRVIYSGELVPDIGTACSIPG